MSYSVDSLFASYKARMMLCAIVNDFSPVRAMRVARKLLDVAPALFQDFANALIDGQDPRAAMWDLSEDLKCIAGGYDLYKESRQCAEA